MGASKRAMSCSKPLFVTTSARRLKMLYTLVPICGKTSTYGRFRADIRTSSLGPIVSSDSTSSSDIVSNSPSTMSAE